MGLFCLFTTGSVHYLSLVSYLSYLFYLFIYLFIIFILYYYVFDLFNLCMGASAFSNCVFSWEKKRRPKDPDLADVHVPYQTRPCTRPGPRNEVNP